MPTNDEHYKNHYISQADVPVISTIGRGPKGDSFEVRLEDGANGSQVLKGWKYNEQTKSWTPEWTSGNIIPGNLTMTQIAGLNNTITLRFTYRDASGNIIWQQDASDIQKSIVLPSVPSPSDAIPIVEGVGAAGVSLDYARADHIHPASGGGSGGGGNTGVYCGTTAATGVLMTSGTPNWISELTAGYMPQTYLALRYMRAAEDVGYESRRSLLLGGFADTAVFGQNPGFALTTRDLYIYSADKGEVIYFLFDDTCQSLLSALNTEITITLIAGIDAGGNLSLNVYVPLIGGYAIGLDAIESISACEFFVEFSSGYNEKAFGVIDHVWGPGTTADFRPFTMCNLYGVTLYGTTSYGLPFQPQ